MSLLDPAELIIKTGSEKITLYVGFMFGTVSVLGDGTPGLCLVGFWQWGKVIWLSELN